MSQLNLNVTPEFEKDLKNYMKNKRIDQKSEAIREAVREAAARLATHATSPDFRSWLGLGLKVSPKSHVRFTSEDDLWGS